MCQKIDFEIILLDCEAQNVLRTEYIWFTCTQGLEGYYNNLFWYSYLLLVLDYLNSKHVNED